MKPHCGVCLFIESGLRAFRGPQKNNDSDEMAPLKSSSKFLLPFSFPMLYPPLLSSGHINIHANEDRPWMVNFENFESKNGASKQSHMCTEYSVEGCSHAHAYTDVHYRWRFKQKPHMFQMIYGKWDNPDCRLAKKIDHFPFTHLLRSVLL